MTRAWRTVVVLLALTAGLAISLSAADNSTAVNGLSPLAVDLTTQLEKGLYARRPSEFASVAKVVALVESGALPRSMVDSSFLWARKKPSKRLQYFQFALTEQARKAGIPINIGAGE
jgi:hypothetical protein